MSEYRYPANAHVKARSHELKLANANQLVYIQQPSAESICQNCTHATTTTGESKCCNHASHVTAKLLKYLPMAAKKQKRLNRGVNPDNTTGETVQASED